MFPQFKANELADFPIPKELPLFEKQLADLAREATELRREDATADTKKVDKRIDDLVFALFDLTPEEIKIVEASGLP